MTWCETCGKGKIAPTCSSRAATKAAGVSDQTDSLFHLGAKMWVRISVNSSNIEANKAQIIYLLRVSLCDISATSKILHFRTFNCCIGINHVCVLPNHSKGLTCLASVLVLVNASISVAAMEGFFGLRKTL